jgi:ceramide glucosyltransferase
VVIIRPCKGIDPLLKDCIHAAFNQDYPVSKTRIALCVSSCEDPAYDIVRDVVASYPNRNATIWVENDELDDTLGPNPKVRNMSRAYHSAEMSHVIWILDSNIWVGPSACRKLVDRLEGNASEGKSGSFPCMMTLHMPIAIDVSGGRLAGAILEEVYAASTYARLYTAINIEKLDTCVTGKSTMFRKSDLEERRCTISSCRQPCNHSGLDGISAAICEDHTISAYLWHKAPFRESYARHGMIYDELAIQPSCLTFLEFLSRHIRWIRCRKYASRVGTLLEPFTDGVLCSGVGAYAAKYWLHCITTYPRNNITLCIAWALSMGIFAILDRKTYIILRRWMSQVNHLEIRSTAATPRPLMSWIVVWAVKEFISFPVWFTAVFGGDKLEWRGKSYNMNLDGTASPISDREKKSI